MSIGKIVLITGVSSGIGKTTAIQLANNGYRVFGTVRNIHKTYESLSDNITLLEMDLTSDATIQKVIEKVIAMTGRIDVLINNAGYGLYGALEDIPIEEARKQMEVNVFGLAKVIQAVLPYMRKQKQGRIINISSIAGSFGEPMGSWYHASKYAVDGLSECLRIELKPFGIDVVLVKPGPIIYTSWNSIARDNLLKFSTNTEYAWLAQKHVKMLKLAEKYGSQASSVAKTIIHICKVKYPKTRYIVGRGARLILFFHNSLPSKIFDSIMLSILKKL